MTQGSVLSPSAHLLSRRQLDNLVLINKIKEQLMAEKIRPPHLPPTSASSQQPLLVPPAPAESSQAVMSLPKLQQVPGLHPQAVPQPDVALHARPATSTVTGGPRGLERRGAGLGGRRWAGPWCRRGWRRGGGACGGWRYGEAGRVGGESRAWEMGGAGENVGVGAGPVGTRCWDLAR